jgi:hypothetical protein
MCVYQVGCVCYIIMWRKRRIVYSHARVRDIPSVTSSMYSCALFPSRLEHYHFLGNELFPNHKTLCLLTSGKAMILRKCAIQDLDLLAQSHSVLEPCAFCVEAQVSKR